MLSTDTLKTNLQVSTSPLPHGAVGPVQKRLLLHVVNENFAGEVGFPPGCLVTAKRTKTDKYNKFFLSARCAMILMHVHTLK